MKPVRLQRLRRKGARLVSPNGLPILCVTRPSKFGNPFTREGCREAGYAGTDDEIRSRCVDAFRVWLTSKHWRENWDGPESERAREAILSALAELHGKNLACFCPLPAPGKPDVCHAAVLLELANATEASP